MELSSSSAAEIYDKMIISLLSFNMTLHTVVAIKTMFLLHCALTDNNFLFLLNNKSFKVIAVLLCWWNGEI